MDWRDSRLSWNITEFDDITDVVIKPDRIWLPELALMNGAEELAPDFRKIRVLLNHDGRVHWEPGGVFTTSCDIDIRYFPFDDQSCLIQFGAWAYYSARMNITNSSHEIQTHEFRLNGEWDIYQTRAEWKENILPCCPNTRYPYVEFTLYLRRRHAFYVMNIVLPCSLLSVLVMVAFCLPPDAGEKVSLGISVLLAFTVFLMMVAENIPRTSLHTPVIVIYLTCTMGLGTFSVCLTVLVLSLHHRDTELPVPRFARLIVLEYLAVLLCVRARKPKTAAAAAAERRLQRGNSVRGKSTRGEGGRGGGSIRHVVRQVGLMQRPEANGHHYDITTELSYDVTSNQNYGVTDGLLSIAGLSPAGTVPAQIDHANDWKELAHVLDRLFFWIVFIAMSASAMMILLVPYYKDESHL